MPGLGIHTHTHNHKSNVRRGVLHFKEGSECIWKVGTRGSYLPIHRQASHVRQGMCSVVGDVKGGQRGSLSNGQV